jgi:lysozyme family protein
VQADYAPFIDRVIQRYEGGYGWNKRDTGGPTKYGITCYDYADYLHLKMDSMSAWAPRVQAMPLDVAEKIYQTKYAGGVNFDAEPAGEDCCTLDYAINSGVSRAMLVRNEIFKKYGTTLPAQDFINRMCDERLAFMKSIRGGSAWAEFGHGWSTRVADLRGYCAHLAAGGTVEAAPSAPDLTHTAQPKATHVAKTAGTVTGGSTLGGAAVTHAAGFHWPTVAAVAAALLAAGVAYEAWQAGNATKANATVHL